MPTQDRGPARLMAEAAVGAAAVVLDKQEPTREHDAGRDAVVIRHADGNCAAHGVARRADRVSDAKERQP